MNIHYTNEIKKQIKEHFIINAGLFIDFIQATEKEDTKYATDMKIRIQSKDIALRVRESSCEYRDLTIRAVTSYTESGIQTEIHKLRKGYGDLYYYAWKENDNKIKDYMLININKLRDSGLLNEDRRIIYNNDGTGFMSYLIKELEENNCILHKEISDLYITA